MTKQEFESILRPITEDIYNMTDMIIEARKMGDEKEIKILEARIYELDRVRKYLTCLFTSGDITLRKEN